MKTFIKKTIAIINKTNAKLLLFIIIGCLFLGVGYAQITEVDLSVEGLATAVPAKTVVIKSVIYQSSVNALEEDSTIEDPYLTLMNSTITLGQTLDSSITYKIKVRNNGNTIASYNDAIYSTDVGYDNTDIEFIVNGITSGDTLNPNEEKEFTITFKYIDSLTNITNNVLNSYINFKFDISDKVARIGDNYFDTLQAAIAAVPKDNVEKTIELLRNTSEKLSVVANQNINFNLNNYTISNSGNNPIMENKGTIKISNGKFVSDAPTQGAVNNQSGGIIKMSGGKILMSGGRQALYNNGGTVEISGTAYLESAAAERSAVQNQANSTMTILGGTIVSTNESGLSNYGNLTIGIEDNDPDKTNPIIQGAVYGVNSYNNKKYDFFNGILKGKTAPTNNTNLIDNVEANYDVVFAEETIDGNNYKTNYLSHGVMVTFVPNGGSLTETTRNIEVGNRIGTLPVPNRNGYELIGWFTSQSGGTEITADTIINSSDTFYAQWRQIVYCRINGVEYNNMQTAINSIPTNGTSTTVEILYDFPTSFVTKPGQNIILDLNGHTISNTNASAGIIENSATMRIINGTIKATSGNAAAINNNSGGHVTVDGTTITATGEKQAIYNTANATVVITGNAYLSSQASGPATDSSLDRATINNLSGGTVYIYSGTIVNSNKAAIGNEGTLIIGTKDGNINTTNPIVQGETYGIVNTDVLNFYDGKIRGITDAISGAISDQQATIASTTESISGKTYKVKYNQN